MNAYDLALRHAKALERCAALLEDIPERALVLGMAQRARAELVYFRVAAEWRRRSAA